MYSEVNVMGGGRVDRREGLRVYHCCAMQLQAASNTQLLHRPSQDAPPRIWYRMYVYIYVYTITTDYTHPPGTE